MSDETTEEEAARQRKVLRRIGYGIVAAGVLTALVGVVSSQPRPIVVYGFLGFAVAVFVVESLEGDASGISVGLVFGSFGGWLWPKVSGESYVVLGATLAVVGLVNAAVAPYFRQLGERIAER